MDSPIITNVILGLTFPSSTCVTTMPHHPAPQDNQKGFRLISHDSEVKTGEISLQVSKGVTIEAVLVELITMSLLSYTLEMVTIP